jgi:hypothetical protein
VATLGNGRAHTANYLFNQAGIRGWLKLLGEFHANDLEFRTQAAQRSKERFGSLSRNLWLDYTSSEQIFRDPHRKSQLICARKRNGPFIAHVSSK